MKNVKILLAFFTIIVFLLSFGCKGQQSGDTTGIVETVTETPAKTITETVTETPIETIIETPAETVTVKETNEIRLSVVSEETGRTVIGESWANNPDIYIGDSSSDGYVNSYISFDIKGLAGAEIVSVTLTMLLAEEFGNRTYLGDLMIGTMDYGTGLLNESVGDIPSNLLVQLPSHTTDINYSSSDLKDELQKNIDSESDRFQLKFYWQNPQTNKDGTPDGLLYLKQDINLVVQYIK
ncbi:MAG: hypothetical protein MUP02_01690 [Actinobacteria bacterium]|nr:hypothetical protein [Actinomycetota bacterium]